MKNREIILSKEKPRNAIVKLAIPAIIALLVKAFYNIVDTFYIGMLNDEIALAAVGVTLPIILISSSVENIFASGWSVLVGKYLGENKKEKSSEILSSTFLVSIIIGLVFSLSGIFFMEDILKVFGASEITLPKAKEYAIFMFLSILVNVPSESLSFSLRAESSVKITTIAVTIGAILNIILDPIFMFSFGLNLGIKGAAMASLISQIVSFIIILWYYLSKRSIIELDFKNININLDILKNIIKIGLPTAIMQITMAIGTALTNISISKLNNSHYILASYGVVQRLIVIGLFIILGFMQGYQPVIAYAKGAKNKERFKESYKFTKIMTIFISIGISIFFILFAKPLISLFNKNEIILDYGSKILISQVLFYFVFGISYMLTVTLQVINMPKVGMLISFVRQGMVYPLIILNLPRIFGIKGLYLSQPIADLISLVILIYIIKKINLKNKIADFT